MIKLITTIEGVDTAENKGRIELSTRYENRKNATLVEMFICHTLNEAIRLAYNELDAHTLTLLRGMAEEDSQHKESEEDA